MAIICRQLTQRGLSRLVRVCPPLRARPLSRAQFDRNGDGFLNVSEFIVAMGVVSDAYDADGDGVADMKQAGGGEYDGKEEEFAEKLALGENLTVAGIAHDNIHKATDDARKLHAV